MWGKTPDVPSSRRTIDEGKPPRMCSRGTPRAPPSARASSSVDPSSASQAAVQRGVGSGMYFARHDSLPEKPPPANTTERARQLRRERSLIEIAST
jgi:hypothetical protein